MAKFVVDFLLTISELSRLRNYERKSVQVSVFEGVGHFEHVLSANFRGSSHRLPASVGVTNYRGIAFSYAVKISPVDWPFILS